MNYSVSANTEERGHMQVCLTHVYLLTQPFSTCVHQVTKLLGRAQMSVRHYLEMESKLRVEANVQIFI